MNTIWEIFFTILAFNYVSFNGKKDVRYTGWYRPWLLVILILVCLRYYDKLTSDLPSVALYQHYRIELAFCMIVIVFWIGLKMLLAIIGANKRLFPLLQKFNKDKVLERKKGYANYLLWPYVIDDFKIRFRNGHKFFKKLFWVAVILLLISNIWSSYYYDRYLLVLPNLLSLLAVPVLLEWIVYFNWKPAKDQNLTDQSENQQTGSNFYQLFARYLDKDHGFFDSWISGYLSSKEETANVNQRNNEAYLTEYIDKINNEDIDLIIGSDNFTDLVPDVAALLLNTIEKGGNILMIADLADHSTYNPSSVGIKTESDNADSVVKLFSVFLNQILTDRMPSAENLIDIGYYSKKDTSGLSKRILICSAEDALSKELIHSEWMKEMDLLMVFQFNDSLANNLGIKRQLSLWLKQQNKSFKSLFFKNYSAGGDEATSVTWISSRDVPEVNLQNIQTSKTNYFINFAYEYSVSNLNQILVGNTNEFDLAPGIELAVFPIMENIDHIHYFEGFGLDYIQSKNKLENLQKSFKSGDGSANDLFNYYENADQSKLFKSILINNLPFIVHHPGNPECNDRHVSVIFDSISNSPKLYQKYMHLGKTESFVCIVSKPHLMREYFAENISFFVASTIEPLELQLSKSKINLCLELLKLLINEQIDIEFIKSLINSHSIDPGGGSVIEFIKKLFSQYLFLDVSKNAILKSESRYVFKDGDYYQLHALSMDRHKLEINEIFEYLKKVNVKDSSGNLILEIPKYLLFQNFLPLQNIIIDGISYEYVQYSEINKELVLKTRPTDIFSFNKPAAVIGVSNHSKAEIIESTDNLGIFIDGRLHRFSSEITENEIEIYYQNYYQFHRFYNSPLSKQQTPKLIDLGEFGSLIEDSKRKYNTRYLHFQWEVPKKYTDRLAELTTRIHHLIYEFLPILFPQRSQYILIASDNNLDERHRNAVPWIFPENNFEYNAENCIEFYVIEDSFADLGILKPIQNFFSKKILTDLYFYLKWISDPNPAVLPPYFQNFKNNFFYKDKLSFLKYGLTGNQISWDIEFLIEFLEDSKLFDKTAIGQGYSTGRPASSTVKSSNVECDYCGNKFKLDQVQLMEDGLHRCKDCAANAVEDEATAKELAAQAVKLFNTVCGVDLNVAYDLKLVSATELNHALGIPFRVSDKFDKRKNSGAVMNTIYLEKGVSKNISLGCLIRELTALYEIQKLNFMTMKYADPKLTEGLPIYAEYILMKNSGNVDFMNYADKLKQIYDKGNATESEVFKYMNQKFKGPEFFKTIGRIYSKKA